MTLDLKGRLLFLWVCYMQLYFTESFSWTVQPANQTEVIKGEDKSLTWNYTLTADEQTKSQTLYFIKWKKSNPSSSDYVVIGSITFFGAIGRPTYDEPKTPHIKISRNNPATLLINNVTTEDEGTFKIEYSLELDGTVLADHEVNVTVLVPPEVFVSKNQSVCEGVTVTLSCNATGKPTPTITWTRVWENGSDSGELPSVNGFYVISNITKSSNGTYCCTASNQVRDPVNKTTEVNVESSSSVDSLVFSSNTVIEGNAHNMSCEVSGDPLPTVSWIKVSSDKHRVGKILNFTNINRNDAGSYTCEASNRCGKDSKAETIIVFYGPSANPLKIKPVTEGEHVTIPCLEDSGNPPAVVTWYKGNDTSGNETTNSSTLEVQNAAPSDEGWYTCFAKNDAGNASATFFLRVAPKTSPAPITEPSTVSILCSKALSENELRVSVTVEADCKNGSQVADKLVDKIVELLKNESCELGVSCVFKCGSVVVDSVLKFSKAIDGARVVSILKEAADQGRFNGLKVVSNSIIQISYTTTSSASTESPSPTEPVCQKSFSEKENCKKNWLNIGIVVCIGVFVFVIICCLITRWVLKQRKCKKDTRVSNSAVDVQPLSSNHSTLSGDKPCDYAMSGPQPPIDVKVAVCEEIPTYAVVDKAKKKDKKKNKKAAEQKAIDDQYAVVDKSKKNKKNEPDNTYAEVDMSNKSKKKPKPGEVLYADLGEFHQMQKLPEVSTSPKTLPPIKRPEAYTETQYADITQFLKGNPEATGADHPKDGAASSASSNGQGPATGSKEESSAGNTGDSAGATNETGF